MLLHREKMMAKAHRLGRTLALLSLAVSSIGWTEQPASDILSTRRDEVAAAKPATAITRLTLSTKGLRVTTDGEVAKFDVLELTNPPRVALDFFDVRSKVRAPKFSKGIVQAIRVAPHEGKVRVVVEFVEPVTPKIARRSDGIAVAFEQDTSKLLSAEKPTKSETAPELATALPKTSELPKHVELPTIAVGQATAQHQPVAPLHKAGQPATPPIQVSPPAPKPGSIPVAQAGATKAPPKAEKLDAAPARTVSIAAPEKVSPPAERGAQAELVDIRFTDTSYGGVLELTFAGQPQYEVLRTDPKGAVLNLTNTSVARGLEKTLDTSTMATPIKTVSIFSVPGTLARARIAVASSTPFEQTITRSGNRLRWELRAKEAGGGTELERTFVASEVAPDVVDPANARMGASEAEKRATSPTQRVSFEFKDIDIHNLLRMMADISKKNIIVTDDVRGKVTLRLRNVPWPQALEIVLRSKGLGKEEFGNIIRVAPLGVLESESKARLEHEKNRKLSAPLTINLIPINYATAEELATRVKEVLTERGNVTTDARTNTLIVREIAENMPRVRALVSSLDLETPQVLIESRIIEASITFSREIGIQWGGQYNASSGTGNPTGLTFPNSVALTGGSSNTQYQGNSTNPNYAVSLPVGVGDGNGGALGLVLGSAGSAAVLNMRLSASEANGVLKTISAPKVTTLDNTTARISQGVSIPFAQVSAAGVNTQFIEARLSLDVTPHITRDGSVMMKIIAQNNQPDPANTGANGQPGISRKEANTTVMVRDGETTVIGGIYVRSGNTQSAGVPFLSKIPVLGFFFRNSRERETKNELLIFITPRILNRTPVAQNQ